MALCKPSSFAEYSNRLQYTNKQEHMMLEKRVAFMARQEKLAKSSVNIDQKLLLMRMKLNLDRSVAADEKIEKIKATRTERRASIPAGNVGCAQILKDAWNENDPLASLDAGHNIPTETPLPLEVALPAALFLLRSQGRKIDSKVLRKAENLETSRRFSPRVSIVSLPTVFTSRPQPGNKHRRSSLDSTLSSTSSRLTTKKSRRQQVSPSPVEPEKTPVRPSSAPKSSIREMQNSREIATALWVASQDNINSPSPVTEQRRPASARPDVGVKQKTVSIESKSENSSESDPEDRVEKESNDRVVVFKSRLTSPDFTDLHVDQKRFATEPLDDLQRKLSESDPQISLVDLHRAAVAAKNYPTRIRRFIRSVCKYKSPSVDVSDDYYSERVLKTSRVCTNRFFA